MMGAGFGNAVAGAIAIRFAACIVAAVAVGAALAFAVPAMWHFVAAHVSVR